MHQDMSQGIRIAIDRGGTFTDFWASIPGREQDVVFKLLSVSPDEYQDAPTEGVRRILEQATGGEIPPGQPLDLAGVESIRMGTTVATNALLERTGEPVALLITKGFIDLLVIGNQARPDIFDLTVKKLDRLYETVIEIDERVTVEGFSEDPDPQHIDVSHDEDLVVGLSGEVLRILKRPDYEAVRRDLQALWGQGIRNLAIALMHSYSFPEHEVRISQIAVEMGFKISVSSQLQPMIKIVPRAQSATADAYLSPVTREYLEEFGHGFLGEFKDEQSSKKLLLSQSDGGLTTLDTFTGLRAVLSGPAGGVVGMAKTCYDEKAQIPVLGFDMGGTSTDVSRFGGTYEHVFESTIAQVTIQSPQLDINTVAAGGGSMLFWRNGLFVVGPESAGALPGPACYGRGGPLTITDANLMLGRLLPDFFPTELDYDATKAKFVELTRSINEGKARDAQLSVEEVAHGFVTVANAAMTRPIRNISEGRGFETSAHSLACFGGAGGQHATAVARDLGIRRVIVHRLSSILSAYGMALADIEVDFQEPESVLFNDETKASIDQRLESLKSRALANLTARGFRASQVVHRAMLNMRYVGSDTALMIPKPAGDEDFGTAFRRRHMREFGFVQHREILVDDVCVRSVGQSSGVRTSNPFQELDELVNPGYLGIGEAASTRRVYFDKTGWTETLIFHLDRLPVSRKVPGPAIILDATQTIVLDPASEATILTQHVIVDLLDTERRAISAEVVDPIHLSIFGHRFMSIAEQMGTTFQKTSISTNIKERLDFSCAVFSHDGSLVANAPHIPGHLGSMAYAIAYQARLYPKGDLRAGDVLLSNHPISGGTHLPDLTVTTPVFDDDDAENILFFVANRGHHADIGGIAAGSMPPNSTELWQEGAAVESFKMVKEGVFDEAGIVKILSDEPSRYPGCSGTRTLRDNIADLKAAIAANQRGISLLSAMIKEYSWPVVKLYMAGIQANAETSVRELLKRFQRRFQGRPLEAVDCLDDGTRLAVKVTIDGETGSADFDFTGTGPETFNNLNAPPAVMYSGIMYCVRTLVCSDIPLNQGCLAPIRVFCPPNTILSPSPNAATVGSNVETSQRIIDLIFKAFQAAAASQGSMNNLTFGYGGTDQEGHLTQGFGYYETIAGGAGAGAEWQGQDGVHTHATNTRMTDPEVLEKRYPVILREFSIRKGSGGPGRNRGGDGCTRDIEMRRPLQVSILSERRVIAPYGMAGGGEGKRGVNLWRRLDPVDGSRRTISLGGKASVMMSPGDRIIIHTPGGGGYGVEGAGRDCGEGEVDVSHLG
ncbi:hypothetical protein QTJ16_004388 [Diplocarpon rosae]|uniref:5-oxoprolinase n=1 Tax=Diplocarpon rosae TaxID=946125 RepID=A0AAD9SYU7_9HELO|nr:hypothetical protein QTJ16_004388 [Diplocarpon rosae]